MGWTTILAFAAALAVPSDRRADTYAVYSAVLAKPSLAHADANTKYLMVDVTGMAQEGRPDSCIHPPDPFDAAMAGLMEDYRALRDKRFRLERELKLSKPYELLTLAEAAMFMDSRRNPPDAELQQRFNGATDLITLGNVYFNKGRTLAAVKTSAWCGVTCGYATWHVLEKVNGRWEERDWIGCVQVAEGAALSRWRPALVPVGARLELAADR